MGKSDFTTPVGRPTDASETAVVCDDAEDVAECDSDSWRLGKSTEEGARMPTMKRTR